ncbi:MAG: hypothetical protein JO129_03565 [Candidatus Dependentiae bacterium]|nr:hypothetical protein [Candidatus Dependentiae bacterium]
MAIVCRKCKYEISEDEISQHYTGIMLNFAKTTMECITCICSIFRKKIEDNQEIKQENKLLGRANYYKIPCCQCFQYNGWIRISDEFDESEKIEEGQEVK